MRTLGWMRGRQRRQTSGTNTPTKNNTSKAKLENTLVLAASCWFQTKGPNFPMSEKTKELVYKQWSVLALELSLSLLCFFVKAIFWHRRSRVAKHGEQNFDLALALHIFIALYNFCGCECFLMLPLSCVLSLCVSCSHLCQPLVEYRLEQRRPPLA